MLLIAYDNRLFQSDDLQMTAGISTLVRSELIFVTLFGDKFATKSR